MDALKRFEAFDFNSSTTVPGCLYGIIFTLYCLCSWSMYLELRCPEKRRHAGFSLGYMSILFVCATALVAFNARMSQLAYLDHPDFPGGPLEYEFAHNPITNAYQAIGGILTLIIEALTMAIQIWRLWLIWSGTKYAGAVTIIPVLLLLSYIALDIPLNIIGALIPFDQIHISENALIAMQTASFAILSAFTILVTALIAARLLLIRKKYMKLMGMSETASPYLTIIVMLVESYVLASAWSLATTISYAVNDPSRLLFGTCDPMIQIIAYFLILYRVANGKGWTKQTAGKLTTLQWNHDTRATTDDSEVSNIRSRVPATASMMAIDSSLPVTHSNSAV